MYSGNGRGGESICGEMLIQVRGMFPFPALGELLSVFHGWLCITAAIRLESRFCAPLKMKQRVDGMFFASFLAQADERSLMSALAPKNNLQFGALSNREGWSRPALSGGPSDVT